MSDSFPLRAVSAPNARPFGQAPWGRRLATLMLGLLLLAGPGLARAAGEPVTLGPAGHRTAGLAFRGAQADGHPRLIVVLHGDAPQGPPSYQYAFAARAAAAAPDAVVLALLRPGYADPQGRRSDGDRGITDGDNYTADRLDQLAAAIKEAQARYHARETILVGHSGGAASSALLMARRPELARRALLVSCPCDLGAWRRHMLVQQKNPVWLLPVHSLSPADLAPRLAPSARIALLVGAEDEVAPPALDRAFLAAARRSNARVTLTVVPGVGHEMLLDPVVISALGALLRAP